MIEVLSTGGDASLGGDDWDAAIVQWLVDEHLRPAGADCEVGAGRGGAGRGEALAGRVQAAAGRRTPRRLGGRALLAAVAAAGSSGRRKDARDPIRPVARRAPPAAQDPRLRANLRAVAEAAKLRLSAEERVVIRMPVGGGVEAVLTRQVRALRGFCGQVA